MMVLYHLHNPEAPAFSSTCNFCHVEIEPGTGLRCTVCTDFDMCKNCKAAGMQHEHPMVVSGLNHPPAIVDVE
jgi:E1A/CREB-binding protein